MKKLKVTVNSQGNAQAQRRPEKTLNLHLGLITDIKVTKTKQNKKCGRGSRIQFSELLHY